MLSYQNRCQSQKRMLEYGREAPGIKIKDVRLELRFQASVEDIVQVDIDVLYGRGCHSLYTEARGVQECIIIAVHEANDLRFVTAPPVGSQDGALVGIGWKPDEKIDDLSSMREKTWKSGRLAVPWLYPVHPYIIRSAQCTTCRYSSGGIEHKPVDEHITTEDHVASARFVIINGSWFLLCRLTGGSDDASASDETREISLVLIVAHHTHTWFFLQLQGGRRWEMRVQRRARIFGDLPHTGTHTCIQYRYPLALADRAVTE
ncbi:hypothetical protein ARMGADRAFT_1146748 [Armillaria gallica]|uniref:Uncharacterized protein n=1 Tax=Armillaria gallica TaxID=47427 RepID=A0A2H3CP62_ARMGA|nr:hypothetical protein ARMGADRAFT_1146748 [Armillaria gallica]